MNYNFFAVRNIKTNISKYSAYFIACFLYIMTIFMFSSIWFNKDLIQENNFFSVQFIIGISNFIFMLFSLFFICYAYMTFFEARADEFAIFIAIGMTNKELYKVIVIENILISIIALITGLFSGTLFSKLYFLAIMKFSMTEKIHFSLDIKNYVFTSFLFLLLFAALNLITIIKIRSSEFFSLLHTSRKPINNKRYDFIISIIGLLIIIISLAVVYFFQIFYVVTNTQAFKRICLNFIILGMYLFIYGLGSIVHKVAKLNKRKYAYNILLFERINFSLIKNRNIIFLLTFLSCMIIYFKAYGYSLFDYQLTLMNQNPYDLVYVEKNDFNSSLKNNLSEILNNGETKITKESDLSFLLTKGFIINNKGNTKALKENIAVTSIDEINKFTKGNYKIKNGQHLLFIDPMSIAEFRDFRVKGIKLEYGGSTATFNTNFSSTIPLAMKKNSIPSYTLVLSPQEFKAFSSKYTASDMNQLKGIVFEDWKKSDGIVKKITEALLPYNVSVNSKYEMNLDSNDNRVLSRFIFSFVEIMLLIISVSTFYYNINVEIETLIHYRKKLNKIGVLDSEIMKIVKIELALLFFIPLIVGVTLSYVYINIVTLNEYMRSQYMNFAFKSAFTYFLLYIFLYFFTKRKYLKEIFQ
jgi:Predicted permease.